MIIIPLWCVNFLKTNRKELWIVHYSFIYRFQYDIITTLGCLNFLKTNRNVILLRYLIQRQYDQISQGIMYKWYQGLEIFSSSIFTILLNKSYKLLNLLSFYCVLKPCQNWYLKTVQNFLHLNNKKKNVFPLFCRPNRNKKSL